METQSAAPQTPTQPAPTEGKQEAKAPVTPGQTPAKSEGTSPIQEAAKEVMKKYKVKVDGQELEVDESELIKGYSHQRAANKLMQEAKMTRKQAEQFIEMMKDKQSLFQVISKLGHDPRKLAEEFLAEQLSYEMMDPKERELLEAKHKLKQFEELDKKQKEAIEKQRMDVLKKKYAEDYSKQFVDALQGSGLPPTKGMVAEMAKYVARAADLGYEISAAEAAKLVKEDLTQFQASLYGSAEGDMLMNLLGEGIANKVRAWDTAKLKTPEAVLKTPPPQEQSNVEAREKAKTNRRMTHREWREFNRK